MALLSINNLIFRYPNEKENAIEQINLTVDEGDFVVICGLSGCGKSTLLRQIKPELSPNGEKTGEIKYNGIPIDKLSLKQSASEIGFVMQNPHNQIVTDKVWHELAFGLESLGVDSQTIRLRVAEMASFFGIDWMDKETTSLSGGQMQLLNLASIMVMQPKLLLLDEPISQLDPIASTEFIETLKKLNRDTGLTIIMVEHNLEQVFSIVDKIIVMDKGKIIIDDKPQNIEGHISSLGINNITPFLPTPLRIFRELSAQGECPLTIRDGRRFLSREYANPKINTLEVETVSTVGLVGKQANKADKADKADKAEVAIELKDVWFAYNCDDGDVLKGIDFTAYKGEIVSIVGMNGSGKSTMLSAMARLITPYKGKIKLDGKPIKSLTTKQLYRNNLAMLPQNPQSVFVMENVYDDLNEICKSTDCAEKTASEEIARVSDLLGISHLFKRHPFDLSGGEQQKVALAKMLLLNPKILLLDEPTKGIDPQYKNELAQTLIALKKSGVAIIIVTHDIEFSASFSDRCAMIFDGEIINIAKTTEFFSGNSFYTTNANKMSRHIFDRAITCKDVISLCQQHEKNQKD